MTSAASKLLKTAAIPPIKPAPINAGINGMNILAIVLIIY